MKQTHTRKGVLGRIVRFYGEWRFTIVMVVILLMICILPMFERLTISAEKFQAILSLLMLFSIMALSYDRRQKYFAVALGIPTLALSQLGFLVQGPIGRWGTVGGEFFSMVFLFGATGLIVQTVMTGKTISADSICGAVSGYLFLGLAWGRLFHLLERLSPGSFAGHMKMIQVSEGLQPGQLMLAYFSFITLTSVGYGDITPASNAAKSLSVVEAISGQFYMAAIVGSLVSVLVSEKIRTREMRHASESHHEGDKK